VGKYDPLRRYLATRESQEHEFQLSFSEIEALVGKIPQSTRNYSSWWNEVIHAKMSSGESAEAWNVGPVSRETGVVTFARSPAFENRMMAVDRPEFKGGSSKVSPDASLEGGDSAVSAGRSRTAKAVSLAAAAIAVGGAIASGFVGVAHLPLFAIIFVSSFVALVAWFISEGIQSIKNGESSWHWWLASTAALLLIIVSAFVYHKTLDPARIHHKYEFVVNGNGFNVISLYGEAGGPKVTLANGDGQSGLIGGESYGFDCQITGPDGARWLRYERFKHTWWAPRRFVHVPYGERQPSVPHC
jgi:hypothetical protein